MRRDDLPRSCRAVPAAVLLLLGGMLLQPGAGSARETPTYFERDYETAKKLHELYEQLEDADTLFMLDSIDDAIVGGGCREEHLFYSEALAEVRKLAERKRAGELLTYDEERYHEDRIEAEKRLWKEFEDCYTEQLRLPSFANGLPPGIDSHSQAVTTYDELREEHGWQQDDGFDAVAAEIEREIEELESQPAYIGTVTSVFRRVELIRRGPPVPLRRGDRIMLRDIVRTGPRGRVRIELADRIEEKNAGPTVVNIGSSSEVSMEKFSFSWRERLEDRVWYEHLSDVIRGSFRAFTKGFTKGFAGEAAFSVRTGTALCGIRGTDVEIHYVPELEEVTYTLHEGIVEITTPGDRVTLEPNQTLKVIDGVAGPVRRAAPAS